MGGVALSPDFIKTLLKQEDGPRSNQTGRIRFYDKEMRCTSRGCSSPTYICLDRIPLCMMHVILKCNELLGDVE
jgi:hypothetical protein